jgi:DNA-binding GntR family transcriptional regulator
MKKTAGTQSLREQAYQSLRRLLVLQQIPEGDRLREPQWAERLGVNRTALREAFARLEAEGLVVRGECTGYEVPVLSEHDIQEIVFVRLTLECAAIDKICEAGTRGKKVGQNLLHVCDEFDRFVQTGYPLGASEADRRFHEVLIDSANNSRLSSIYHRAPLPLVHRRIEAREEWIEQCRLIAAEHRAIANSIGRSDARLAKQTLKGHLRARFLLAMSA